MKMERLRSPFGCESDSGVMCSATQEGFRSRRSKEEISAWRVARSAMGPGNPYWKRPAGSTGGIISLAGSTPGIGTGAEEVDVAETVVEEATTCTFFSDRVEYMAAVIPAPVAAPAAAIRASVVLDILTRSTAPGGGGPRGIYLSWGGFGA